jgi:hypothetical protein
MASVRVAWVAKAVTAVCVATWTAGVMMASWTNMYMTEKIMFVLRAAMLATLAGATAAEASRRGVRGGG